MVRLRMIWPIPDQVTRASLKIEHPTGEMTVVATLKGDTVASAAILRTARKLMDGIVFIGDA